MTTPDMFVIGVGPDEDELWNAAKSAYDGVRVSFIGARHRGSDAAPLSMEMQILGLVHNDESGHNFQVTAFIVHPACHAKKMTFCYDALARTGFLVLM